ncbi:hypothetical protein [Novosphingobium sp. HR1a]|uniref:hypothetical protein n=1 Tax=Novosphingobium sp. HR1a TaxID=1395637 RepID=UPI001B3C5BE1|nr:hypothetical protein [Novosphingobium sp. HR1a]
MIGSSGNPQPMIADVPPDATHPVEGRYGLLGPALDCTVAVDNSKLHQRDASGCATFPHHSAE